MAALADAPAEPPDRVVVVASRAEESINDVPYRVETFSAEKLRTGTMASSIPDALLYTPSVMVQQTARGQGSPYVRGFTGFRTLAMVDGIRLNNSTFRDGPNQYWATVDTLAIGRLELLEGPAGVMHGSDAIGGAINALMSPIAYGAQGQRVHEGAAYYRVASADNSHVGRVQYSEGVAGKWGYAVGISGKTHDDLRAGHPVGRQPYTGYDQWDADMKAEVDLRERSVLTFAYQRSRQLDVKRTHRTIHGIRWEALSRGNDLEHEFDQFRELAYARLRTGTERGDVFTATVSWQVQDEVRAVEKANKVFQDDHVYVGTAGVSLQGVSPSAVGEWTYGAEHYHDAVAAGTINRSPMGAITGVGIQGPVADESTYDLFGAFVQDKVSLPMRATFTAGGRYTWARAGAGRAQDPTTRLPVSYSDSWQSMVGNGRLLWHPDEAEHWGLFIGIGQGFRAPNLSDLTRFDIARSGELETPSFQLNPEEFLSADAGVRVASGRWAFSGCYYRTWIQDMIVPTPTGQVVNGLREVVKRNGAQGYVEGVEWDGELRCLAGLALYGSAAWQQGETDYFPALSPVGYRAPMSRGAPTTGIAGTRWTPETWLPGLAVEVFGQFSARQDQLSPADALDTQRIPPRGTPGWMTANLRVNYAWRAQVRASFAFENWLDESYRIHGSGVNQPGRNFRASLDWRF